VKYNKQQTIIFQTGIGVVSGLFFFVLSITESVYAQSSCSEKEIGDYISQLAKAEPAAFDALVKCRAKAVPALTQAINNPNETTQITAIAALGEIGQDATPAVSILLKQMRNKNADIQAVTWNTISHILDRDQKQLISIVIIALKDNDLVVDPSTADALMKVDKDAVPDLIIALKSPSQYLRSMAADALGKIGKDAKNAVPDLIIVLEDPDSYVRSKAVYALGKIGKDAVPDLIIALKSLDKKVRSMAADALGKIGKDAKDAVPTLKKLIVGDDVESIVALDALYRISRQEASRIENRILDHLYPYHLYPYYYGSARSLSRTTTSSLENIPLVCRIPTLSQVFSWKCPK
jgi:HEAT repeat protein